MELCYMELQCVHDYFYNMYNSMNKCVRELCKNNVSLVTMHWIKLQINAPEWRDTIPWFGRNQKENGTPFKQQQ